MSKCSRVNSSGEDVKIYQTQAYTQRKPESPNFPPAFYNENPLILKRGLFSVQKKDMLSRDKLFMVTFSFSIRLLRGVLMLEKVVQLVYILYDCTDDD